MLAVTIIPINPLTIVLVSPLVVIAIGHIIDNIRAMCRS